MASSANNEETASAQETGDHSNAAAAATGTSNNNRTEAMAAERTPRAVVQVPPPADAPQAGNHLPLDWTQLGGAGAGQPQQAPPVRYPADVAELLPDEDTAYEICIVGTAGQKITHIGPDFSSTVNPNLKQLILRSHIIRTMEGLDKFAKLELLELYDNQVDALECLDKGPGGTPGTNLKTLDMSYNVIREMKPISLCPNLQELCKCLVGWLFNWLCACVHIIVMLYTIVCVLLSCILSLILPSFLCAAAASYFLLWINHLLSTLNLLVPVLFSAHIQISPTTN